MAHAADVSVAIPKKPTNRVIFGPAGNPDTMIFVGGVANTVPRHLNTTSEGV